ncbi:hypothetical protein TRVL_08560 [Trypanosoma vivax]|nr:hypothetical protein TRVL_08560 [Trypanosoma vivax]
MGTRTRKYRIHNAWLRNRSAHNSGNRSTRSAGKDAVTPIREPGGASKNEIQHKLCQGGSTKTPQTAGACSCKGGASRADAVQRHNKSACLQENKFYSVSGKAARGTPQTRATSKCSTADYVTDARTCTRVSQKSALHEGLHTSRLWKVTANAVTTNITSRACYTHFVR